MGFAIAAIVLTVIVLVLAIVLLVFITKSCKELDAMEDEMEGEDKRLATLETFSIKDTENDEATDAKLVELQGELAALRDALAKINK